MLYISSHPYQKDCSPKNLHSHVFLNHCDCLCGLFMNVQADLFQTMKVNGDYDCQVSILCSLHYVLLFLTQSYYMASEALVEYGAQRCVLVLLCSFWSLIFLGPDPLSMYIEEQCEHSLKMSFYLTQERKSHGEGRG